MQDSGGFAGYEESLKGENEGFAGLSLPGGLPNPFAAAEEVTKKVRADLVHTREVCISWPRPPAAVQSVRALTANQGCPKAGQPLVAAPLQSHIPVALRGLAALHADLPGPGLAKLCQS